jgi:hypothetical protein
MHLKLQSVRYEYLSAPGRQLEDSLDAIFVEYSEWHVFY